MEFERRTTRGKAAEDARQEADEAEYRSAETASEAMQAGVQARRDKVEGAEGGDEPHASTSTAAPTVEEMLHNLDMAQRLIASGQVSAPSLAHRWAVLFGLWLITIMNRTCRLQPSLYDWQRFESKE